LKPPPLRLDQRFIITIKAMKKKTNMFGFVKSNNNRYNLDFYSLVIPVTDTEIEKYYQELVKPKSRLFISRAEFRELVRRSFITQNPVLTVLHGCRKLHRRECFCCYEATYKQDVQNLSASLHILFASFQLDRHLLSDEFREILSRYAKFAQCGEADIPKSVIPLARGPAESVVNRLNQLPGVRVAYVVDGSNNRREPLSQGTSSRPRISFYRTPQALEFLNFVESNCANNKIACMRNVPPKLGLVYYYPQCQVILLANHSSNRVLQYFWQFLRQQGDLFLDKFSEKI
jgi:hypothetical protein